jgi:hypothetical protein
MAEIIKTLRASGGDYTHMSTWESTQQGDLTTTNNPEGVAHTAVLECYNDWAGDGLEEANGVVIGGWVTDATNSVIVRAATGEGHGGVYGAGFRMWGGPNFGYVLNIGQDYCRFQEIEIRNIVGNRSCLTATAQSVPFSLIVDRVIGHNTNTGSYNTLAGRQAHFINCLAIGSRGVSSAIGFHQTSGTTGLLLENCTAIGGDYGFRNTAGNDTDNEAMRLYNCVAFGADISDFGAVNVRTGSTANASEDATAPGTSAVTGLVAEDFVNYTRDETGDYNPAPGNQLDGANNPGVVLSFSEDITGATRSEPWERGAYDIIVAGAHRIRYSPSMRTARALLPRGLV